MSAEIKTAFGRAVAQLEETLIAILLGLMTLITFANVVARFGFEANILWALEATVFLFAWLVLLGCSYAVRVGAHLGVDVIIAMVPRPVQKIMGLIAVAACIVFAFLLLKGAWDYWANFANLPRTEGRWFPLGFEEKFRDKGWYEVNDIAMPEFLQGFFSETFNEGERYEKIPRLIPYIILPISMALLLFRFLEAGFYILRGDITAIIASHEAEDLVEEAAAKADKEG